jgi:type II secretory pathway component PulF
MLFVNATSNLTASGLLFVESVEILSTQWRGVGRDKILTLHRSLQNGLDLTTAFVVAWPLDKPSQAMLKMGHETGDLSAALGHIHAHLSFKEKSRTQINKALRYPLLLLVMVLVCGGLLCHLLLPTLLGSFKENNRPLPLATQALVSIWEITLKHGKGGVLTVGGLGILTAGAAHVFPPCRLVIEQLVIRCPGFGPLAVALAWGSFFRIWHLLVSRGISLVQGLTDASESLLWICLGQVTQRAHQKIMAGSSLTEAFQSGHGLDSFVGPLLLVGEKTGQLSPVLEQISVLYQQKAQAHQERLLPMLEPLCLLMLGSLLLLVICGTLLPLYDQFMPQDLAP